MRFTWLSCVKDLRRLRSDPIALLVWIGVPVFIAVIFSSLFGRAGSPVPTGKLLVVDEDQSIATNFLLGAFNQGDLGRMIQVEKVLKPDGERRINRGEASALLIIPKGFGAAVLKDEPSKLRLLTNPSQSILPNIIQQVLEMLLDAGFYVQKIAGDQMRKLADGRVSEQSVAEISVTLNRLGTRVAGYVNPLRIEIETKVIDEKKSGQLNFASLMLPGQLFMAVLFICGGLAADVWKERRYGTLRRLATAPVRIESFIGGKVLSTTVIVMLIGAVGLIAARLLLNMPAANSGLAILWIGFAGIAMFLLMTSLQVAASTERGANLMSNMILLPLMMLGGGMFPFEAMPNWMAAIGKLTPNGWAVVQLRAILDGSTSASSLAAAFTGLLIFSAVCFLFVASRLRGRFVA
jgi:ABC-type multidrug transport system permease subunit